MTGARLQDPEALSGRADLWYQYLSNYFLHGYLTTLSGSDLLPQEKEQHANLLVPYLLEKAVYELGYELNNRPDWLVIPLRGLRQVYGE